MYRRFAYIYVFAPYVAGSLRGQKRVASHLGLGLGQLVISNPLGTGSWTQVPLEEQTLSHLSILIDNLIVALICVILVTGDTDC